MSRLKSIRAVSAGVLAIFVLSLGTDVILHVLGFFPPWGQPITDPPLIVATVYRTIYGVVGGYVTARLAPARPMAHAIGLGLFGIVLATAGAVATWNGGPAFGNHWYPIALIVISLPCSWLGGRLCQK